MTINGLDYAQKAISIKPKLAELRKASDALQTNFVQSLLKEMRQGLDEDSDMPGSDVYNGMVNDALAEQISKKANFGISDMLFNQLSQLAVSQVHLSSASTGSNHAPDQTSGPTAAPTSAPKATDQS